MRCAQWAVRDCLPTAAYPVPQSVTEREQSCRSLITDPEQIADSASSTSGRLQIDPARRSARSGCALSNGCPSAARLICGLVILIVGAQAKPTGVTDCGPKRIRLTRHSGAIR